ncbi:hypothetical protein [Microbacterium arabinogalactanolyticum]|uniref:hypothetical protein n=1 Tax=Microbacterium arabinogalactanolyticum TaxID=69365 RepID=UPI002556FD7D|nr:hypothetical protein [Microbacterium arabinogalactanolyticum]
MANKDEEWPPPPQTDEDAFQRVTEGQQTILGTGGEPPREKPIPSARPKGE